MLYFGINGDAHAFSVPFDYLEKVILHFYFNKYGDDCEFHNLNVQLYYAMDSNRSIINKIQMLLFPNRNNDSFLITIDVENIADKDTVWYSNFYRFFWIVIDLLF